VIYIRDEKLKPKNCIKIGKTEIELPDYMISLSQELVDNVLSDSSTDIRIVACGVHPDGKVTLITSKAEVRTFDPVSFHVPEGMYVPLPGGTEVYLPNTNGRWPGLPRGFQVKSSWLLENSQSAFDGASLQVNNRYIGEIDVTTTEMSNT